MNPTQRLSTEEALPATRAIPRSPDPCSIEDMRVPLFDSEASGGNAEHQAQAGASDQTSDLACRRKVGAFDITIRK